MYLSRCRGAVEDSLIQELANEFEDDVAILRVVDDLFDPDTQERIVRDIHDAEAEAVVLAGHSLDHYLRSLSGRLLYDRIVGEGINPNRVVFTSLYEHVAVPHRDDPEGALGKARALTRVALLRATMLEAAEKVSMASRRAVLILGATVEGVVAAQRLLQLGYRVVIADRGNAFEELERGGELGATIAFVSGHANAEVVANAQIADGLGWVGDYEVALSSDGDVSTFRVGGILLTEPTSTDWVEELRRHFRVDVDDEGHARSINPATHPAETVEPGLMVIPPVVEPTLRNRVAAADSAAMALVLRLSRPETEHYVLTSKVDESLCGGCASCVKTCAFGACTLGEEDGLSHVEARRCRACGKCVVSCPVGARDLVSSPHDFLVKSIRELAKAEVEAPRILGIVCGGCGNPAMNAGGLATIDNGTFPASFLPLWIPCGGRLDALYVLEAFKAGFDGVSVYRCREGHCHNLIGNLDMDRRVNLLRTVLRSRGIDDTRLRIVDISPTEGLRFIETVNDLHEALKGIKNGKGAA